MFLFYLLMLLSSQLATAVKFTFPATEDTTINLTKPLTISWETNATDPTIGKIVLVQEGPDASILVVANRVEIAERSFTTRREFVLGVESGPQYHFEFWQAGTTEILATSSSFSIEGGRNGESDATSSGDLSGSTSVASSTTTTRGSSTGGASSTTSSQTVTASIGSPSPSSSPNQGSATSSQVLLTGGLGVGRFMCALWVAVLVTSLY